MNFVDKWDTVGDTKLICQNKEIPRLMSIQFKRRPKNEFEKEKLENQEVSSYSKVIARLKSSKSIDFETKRGEIWEKDQS
jgi:hypothetical protein